MREGIIYCVTSPSGKKYIGRTIQKLNRRKFAHNALARGTSKLYFHNAIRKYGPKEMIWEVIETRSHEDPKKLIEILNELEIFHIDAYETLYPDGYNLTEGGGSYLSGGSTNTKGKSYEELYGSEKALEIKNKISENTKGKIAGRKQPQELIDRRAKSNTGKKRTQETKDKTRQSLLGVKHTDERRKNISDAHKGKDFSKNFGPPRYGADNPSYIHVPDEIVDKIIYLHTTLFLGPVAMTEIISKTFKISGGKIIKILKERNLYIKCSELCKMRKLID
jgi:predicted GIY-YIG superfamily endonuclease